MPDQDPLSIDENVLMIQLVWVSSTFSSIDSGS